MDPTLSDSLLALKDVRHRAAARKLELIEEICGGDPELVTQVLALLETAQAKKKNKFAGLNAEELHETMLSSALEPFRIVRLVGHGPSATVYLAEHSSFGSTVAVKLFRSSEVQLETQEQVGILQKLHHPAIPPVYSAGALADGRPWFATEYVEGLGIVEFCETHAVPIIDRLLIFRRICEAVQHAHQHGVVHADIKPSNILLNSAHAVRILDFGIATRPNRGLLSKEATAYLAPEQAAAGPIGFYTDVYALGVLIFHLLTGNLPSEVLSFDRASRQSFWQRWSRRRTPLLGKADVASDMTRTTRSRVNHLYEAATSGDFEDRYQSVDMLLRDIDSCLREMEGLGLATPPDHESTLLGLPQGSARPSPKPRDHVQAASELLEIDRCSQPAEVIQKLREGLFNQAWMLDFTVGDPFVLRGFVNAASEDELATWFVEHPEFTMDVSKFIQAPAEGSFVLLGQYPSGAIRGIPAVVNVQNGAATLHLYDSICLLDPDSESDVALPERLRFSLNVLALREVHRD